MGKWLVRLLIFAGNLYRRMLAMGLHLIGPRAAYGLFAFAGRRMYRLLDPLRNYSEKQCLAALGDRLSQAETRRISEQAFVHRCWNLADLMLADWRVRERTCAGVGGQIPEPYRGMLRDAVAQRKPVILLTAYYGPFDLLPLFLGYNGIPAGAVYLPHANARFDVYRRRIRTRSGCSAIPVADAINELPRILESGGAVALLSDHHATKGGVEVEFLGIPTAASRAVGILAARYDAIVAVAAIRRTNKPFRFEIVVGDYFDATTWRDDTDPVITITKRYLAAIERIVRDDPTQYLWAHARWGASAASAQQASPGSNSPNPSPPGERLGEGEQET
ncbi:MAG: lysophospholipid acyltransferase family protein [Phycisphaerales bacterium]|nr:lysophospholipid acyltransferase family protein [Phycisphaerales bacterium]